MKNKTFSIAVIWFLISCLPAKAEPFRVLIFLPNKYGANYFLNKANFENFGWKITIAGTHQNIYPCPVYAAGLGCPLVQPDTLISEIASVTAWDALVVMSGSHYVGNPCGNLLSNQHALQLINHAADSGLVVGGYCTGVRVLAAADVIGGKTVTGHPYYEAEYVAAGASWAGKNKPPQIQDNVVTCSAGDFFNNQKGVFRKVCHL